jgi:hypothetical protein
MTGALQSLSYHALVLVAGAGFLGSQDLGVRRHKSPDELSVFVINSRDFLAAEKTDFFNWLLRDRHRIEYLIT